MEKELITLTLPADTIENNALGAFDFIAMLGNADSTDLILESSKAINGNLIMTEKSGIFLFERRYAGRWQQDL